MECGIPLFVVDPGIFVLHRTAGWFIPEGVHVGMNIN